MTLAHLMAHGPGFDEHVFGLFGRDPSTLAALKPLGEILAREPGLAIIMGDPNQVVEGQCS